MKNDKDSLKQLFSEWLDKNFGGSEDNHKQEVESDIGVVKALDSFERRALFVVLEPQDSEEVTSDLHGDYYDSATVEKACINFNKHCMKAGLFHEFEVDNDLIQIEQTFITPSEFTLDDGRLIKKGTWLMWMHFPEPLDGEDDFIWNDVLSGEFNGVSVQCRAYGVNL